MKTEELLMVTPTGSQGHQGLSAESCNEFVRIGVGGPCVLRKGHDAGHVTAQGLALGAEPFEKPCDTPAQEPQGSPPGDSGACGGCEPHECWEPENCKPLTTEQEPLAEQVQHVSPKPSVADADASVMRELEEKLPEIQANARAVGGQEKDADADFIAMQEALSCDLLASGYKAGVLAAAESADAIASRARGVVADVMHAFAANLRVSVQGALLSDVAQAARGSASMTPLAARC